MYKKRIWVDSTGRKVIQEVTTRESGGDVVKWSEEPTLDLREENKQSKEKETSGSNLTWKAEDGRSRSERT